ncbi:MAG: hypothetical protein V5A59_07345 [Bacteroidales bacterium]|nr:hypothetical protein [Bacteroidales bacterium]MBS3775997.1 hypothetical protein [Bacteroidales bacterium]
MIKSNHQWVKYALIFMLSLGYLSAYGQLDTQEKELKSFYGTNISQNMNGLVLNRTVMSGQYQKERRTFEMGILMNEFKAVSGFVFKHRYFLNKTEDGEVYQPESYALRPHLFYRFVYNSNMPENYLNHPVYEGNGSIDLMKNSRHTINTIEHYLGIGLEIDVWDNMYLNTSVSGGFYFFKDNMEAVRIDGQLLPEASTGVTFNVSTGIGFHF